MVILFLISAIFMTIVLDSVSAVVEICVPAKASICFLFLYIINQILMFIIGLIVSDTVGIKFTIIVIIIRISFVSLFELTSWICKQITFINDCNDRIL